MLRPQKQFGQHWLRSDKALSRIISAADLSKSDRVLEIGPGTGILTRSLLPLVESVIAVEIDHELCKTLVKKLREKNLLLLQGDILSLDLAATLAAHPTWQKPNKVVANIPYNITGLILENLLGTLAVPAANPFDLIVLLVQKEVAQRLSAQPGTKSFAALSVRLQYLATCEFICDVPAKAFYPPPKVDSAVVRLRPRPYPTPAQDPRWLDTLIKLGFAARRKMLRNNLQSLVDRDCLAAILEQLAINPQARAEDLSVDQWVTLSHRLRLDNSQIAPASCVPTP